ncbi:MAG TPA: SDR family oxidoreductase [Propionibacteriaceae bacterium]|nr:SDR family oxidoreductase [Propionibacteriaceae bacterium]
MSSDASTTRTNVLLVTGAGRGIGAATARLAAGRGWAVCVNYVRDEASAQAVVDDISRTGGEAIAVQADVGRAADVSRLFAQVDSRLGRLTGLVNNAGTLERQARVDDIDEERLLRVLRTNVVGTFLASREAVLRMSTRHGGQGGAIVNVSSVASRIGSPGEYVDYAASKGAVDTFTHGLALEVAAEGVRVNAVRPGIIETEIHASGGEAGRPARLAPTLPMKRPGRPEEVAEAILWLLSDAASYTTGTIVDVSGGR